MKNKYYKNMLWLFLLLAGVKWANAQCNINDYTLTPISGACVADGKLQVQINGATTCTGTSGVTAILYQEGSDDEKFITLSASGSGVFNNLAPGNYQVELLQGGNSITSSIVKVTSTYVPIAISLETKNLTCSDSDALFSENGEIKASFTGGNGPFEIKLTGPNGTTTTTVASSPASHTFTGLEEGNYTVTVTDLSAPCNSSETRTATITQTEYDPLVRYRTNRMVNESCDFFFKITTRKGNTAALLNQGNSYYTIEGDPTQYPFTISQGGTFTDFRTGAIPANTNVTYFISDGCNTLTGTNNTLDYVDSYGRKEVILEDENCNLVYRLDYEFYRSTGNSTYYWNSPAGEKAYFYKEVPADSDNWVLVDQDIPRVLNQNTTRNYFIGDDVNTRYKLVVGDSNSCWTTEVIEDARDVSYTNYLDDAELFEINGILEGTTGFRVGSNRSSLGLWNATYAVNAPITISIDRVDNQSSMTINPTMPTDFAGSYTIDFPYVFTTNDNTSWQTNQPIFGDLPLGEYEVTLTDRCGYSVVRTIDLQNAATYNPNFITETQGCSNSDILYEMLGSNIVDEGVVQLYENNNGNVGSLVRDESENPSNTLSGQFSTINPGEYFLEFSKINFWTRDWSTIPYRNESSHSVARQITQRDFKYYEPVTIQEYTAGSFNTVSLFCSTTDNNSGILGITASGSLIDYINYQVWHAADNPDTDPAAYEYFTNDVSEDEHVFTGLGEGEYIVRVSTQCGFTQQNVTLENGTTSYPPAVVSKDIVCGNDSFAILAIGLPTSMFDIAWRDGGGNIISTKRLVTVQPTATETFNVQYQLKSSLGCNSAPLHSEDVTVTVVPIYQPPTNTTAVSSAIGISTLNREPINSSAQWPLNMNSAYLVLDSKEKGFVITSLTTSQIQSIHAQEGMIVFDTDLQCLKLYDGTQWHCTKQTCDLE